MSLNPEALRERDEYRLYQELGGRVGVRQFNWAVQLVRDQSVRERLIREGNTFQRRSFALNVREAFSLSNEIKITEKEANIYALLRCKQAPIDKTGESFSRMCDQSLLIETFLLILVLGDGDRNVLRENLKRVLQEHTQFPPGVKKRYEKILFSLASEAV